MTNVLQLPLMRVRKSCFDNRQYVGDYSVWNSFASSNTLHNLVHLKRCMYNGGNEVMVLGRIPMGMSVSCPRPAGTNARSWWHS
jgi:hypothetical protein